MACSKDINNSLFEMITCPICYEKSDQLKALPCQHTVCLVCVSRLKVSQNKFNCPTCNKALLKPNGGFDQLPDCLLAKQIAELVKQNLPSEASSAEIPVEGSLGAEELNKDTEDVGQQKEEEQPVSSRNETQRVLAPKMSTTQLCEDLKKAINRGKQWQEKTTEQEKAWMTKRENIPKTIQTARDAIIAYQEEIKQKCEKKLRELAENEADQTTELDSQRMTLKSHADSISAAIQSTPEILSKLADPVCDEESVAQAREQLERLTNSTDALATFNFETENNVEALERGDYVRLTVPKEDSIKEFLDCKISMSSVGIFVRGGLLGTLSMFPEKPNYMGSNLRKVQEKAKIPFMGDYVRVKESVKEPHFSWKGVKPLESHGILQQAKLKHPNVPDDDVVVTVDFPEERGWKGLYSEIELVPGSGFQVGDEVQVRSTITEPSRGWGNVTGSSIGKVIKIEGEEGKEELTIDFPECHNWVGLAKEVEVPVKLKKGDIVQVRKTVKRPRLGWNGASHDKVGELIKMPDESDPENTVQVKFQGMDEPWTCVLEELELINKHILNIPILGNLAMNGLGMGDENGIEFPLGMHHGNGMGFPLGMRHGDDGNADGNNLMEHLAGLDPLGLFRGLRED